MTDLFARVPPEVTIVEVGPRDGLQNEPTPVPLAAKVAPASADCLKNSRRLCR